MRVGRRGLGSVLGLLGGVVAWFIASDWVARMQGRIESVPEPPWWARSLPWRVLDRTRGVVWAFAATLVSMMALVAATGGEWVV